MVNTQSDIPAWLKQTLHPVDLEQITAVIQQVERATDGEIVPVIVHKSTMTSHVATICILLLWFFASAVVVEFHLDLSVLKMSFGLGVLTVLGWGLGRLALFTRLLTPTADLELQVWRRAQSEFLREGIGRTKRATGILLFVSMVERRAVVLADQAIAAKYPQETWVEVVGILINALKKRQMGSGLCAAIARCGQIIAPHFPPAVPGQNHLPDRLVIRE
jgi:putative membrane protein